MISHQKYALILFALVVVAIGVIKFTEPHAAVGGATPGNVASISTATTTAVGPQAVPAKTIFSKGTDCEARVISTQASPIMISFGEGVTGNVSSSSLAATIGHFQGASTTVLYDAETFGCGTWTVWAWSSSTITHSEY